MSFLLPAGTRGYGKIIMHFIYQDFSQLCSPPSKLLLCYEISVLTAASMKMAVFWVVVPWSLQKFQRAMTHRPDDGASTWNVGKLLPDYTAQRPRRQPSSSLLLPCTELSLAAFVNSLHSLVLQVISHYMCQHQPHSYNSFSQYHNKTVYIPNYFHRLTKETCTQFLLVPYLGRIPCNLWNTYVRAVPFMKDDVAFTDSPHAVPN
jgi:hypothetical protein